MPRLLALVCAVGGLPAATLACGDPPTFDGDSQTGVSVSVGRIADVIWVPQVIDGGAVPDDAGLSLEIGPDGAVTGATGCNQFSGMADLDAGSVQFGAIAVTERACLDADRMEREAAFLKALTEVRGFTVSSEGLWLLRENGSVAMCLGPE